MRVHDGGDRGGMCGAVLAGRCCGPRAGRDAETVRGVSGYQGHDRQSKGRAEA